MRFFKLVVAGWALFAAVVLTVAALDGGLSQSPAQATPPSAVLTNLSETGMLEGDMRMLERMRVGGSSSMNTMIGRDPMWVDPDMVQAQEQYQAQLDRMIAGR